MPQVPQLFDFHDVVSDSNDCSKRHLILGNGFSIGCRAEIFHYASLFGEADFSSVPEVEQVFEALGVQDFEIAIRALESGSQLFPIYAPGEPASAQKMLDHSQALKEILVSTIAGNHPDIPLNISEDEFRGCRQFLSHFLGPANSGDVYTLNYDLLLYWTLMHDDVPEGADQINLAMNDGFGNDEEDPEADYVVWQGETAAHGQRVHYLHGALHLFDAGSELKKYTWIRKGIPLIEQTREAINADTFPLFVAEGQSAQKKAKIRHNAYLHHSYKSLVANANQKKPCFFIFGHSLAENDDHILRRLGRGKFPKLYIGLYGDPKSDGNQTIVSRASELAMMRRESSPLDVIFFDAASADVWGHG